MIMVNALRFVFSEENILMETISTSQEKDPLVRVHIIVLGVVHSA